ncbi:hypothetical protein D9615_001351 [Tricholomella constricta]|uniref:Uncharacterized protein n=1 Tax=Tricholomella constricta TaxID=117010 RepID=A0A8H5HKG6_9AGAR|nr:hypothetical protein D9615_001351 [Tricholomella constricta]
MHEARAEMNLSSSQVHSEGLVEGETSTSKNKFLQSRFARSLRGSLRSSTREPEYSPNNGWTEEFQIISHADLPIQLDNTGLDPASYPPAPNFSQPFLPSQRIQLVDLCLDFPQPPTFIPSPIDASVRAENNLNTTSVDESFAPRHQPSNRFKSLKRLVRSSLSNPAAGKSTSFVARFVKPKAPSPEHATTFAYFDHEGSGPSSPIVTHISYPALSSSPFPLTPQRPAKSKRIAQSSHLPEEQSPELSHSFPNLLSPTYHPSFQDASPISAIYVGAESDFRRSFSVRPSFNGSFITPNTRSQNSSSSGYSILSHTLPKSHLDQENQSFQGLRNFPTAWTQRDYNSIAPIPHSLTSEHFGPDPLSKEVREHSYLTSQGDPTAFNMDYSGKRTDVVDVGGEVDYSNHQWFQDPPARPPPAAPQPEYIPAPEVIQMNDAFEYALSSAPNVLYARYKQYGQLGVLAWCSEFGELIDGLKELGFNGNMFTTTRSQALRTCQQLLKLPMDIDMQIIVMYLSSQVSRLRRFLDGDTSWDDYPIPSFPQYPGDQPR